MGIRSDSKLDQKLTEQIRLEFVEGVEEDQVRVYPTLEGLVKKHDVPSTTLYRRAKEDEWQRQRNEFKSAYDAKRSKDRAERKAQRADKFDDTSLSLAESLLARVGRKLAIAARRDRDESTDSLAITELKDMAETVLKAQKAGKLALGEAGEIKQVVSDDAIPTSLTRIIDRLDQLAEEKSQGASHTLQ